MRGRGHDCFLSAFSKGRAALGGAGDPGGGRRDDGGGRNIFLQRAGVAAPVGRGRDVDRGIAAVAPLEFEAGNQSRLHTRFIAIVAHKDRANEVTAASALVIASEVEESLIVPRDESTLLRLSC